MSEDLPRDQCLSGVVIRGKSDAAVDVSYQSRTIRVVMPGNGALALNGEAEVIPAQE
jgi:hypothetical protein